MKKTVLILSLICVFCSAAYADIFDNLTNLTPSQKQQLTIAHNAYKQENNSIETRIMDYNNKLAQLKNDKEKSESQISLLSSAYQRNLETLKSKQAQLQKDTDAKYKSIMTLEQYNQYKAQEVNVQDSFNKFLQK
ncbi:MAG: hypothetical protein LUG16_09005 [Candidatus Gastranaerophilales bacterium]|nr:hypothetical protein [Candidatus Gastranaerophilales bacterium]